jgi:phosphate-transporting ATPase
MLTVSGLKRLHISASFDLQDEECVALQGPSEPQRGPIP